MIPERWTLFCLVDGDSVETAFPVVADPTSTVGQLKEEILRKNPELGDVNPKNLQIWKVCLEVEDLEQTVSLANLFQGPLDKDKTPKRLSPLDTLTEYWMPGPSAKRIHVIVLCPEDIRLQKKRKAEEDAEEDAEEYYIATKLKPLEPPSKMSKAFRQDANDPTFHDHRPLFAYGYPTELLHPIFGQFLDDCEESKPTWEMYQWTYKMCEAMSAYYSDEELRGEKFQNILSQPPWGILLRKESFGASTADGVWFPSSESRFAGMMVQSKNEVGSSGDPHIQATGYYTQYLLHYLNDGERGKTQLHPRRLPCFLLSVFGPFLSIAFAINGRLITVDQHIAPIPLATSLYNIPKIARIFMALRNGLVAMKDYYCTVPDFAAQRRLPYPRSFTYNKKVFRFSYCLEPDGALPLDPQNVERLVFLADILPSNEDSPDFTFDALKRVVIKFVQQYPKDIHMACATIGIAPKIYDFAPLPGGWFMVVMEYLGSQTIADIPNKSRFEPAVRAALSKLHGLGYVHGDVRASNISIRASDNAVLFIDWDWAGRDGLMEYPLDINPEVARHHTAGGGDLIVKEHDLYMLEMVFH